MVGYFKLKDGSWGLRGLNLNQGERVKVTRTSDGEQKFLRVGRIIHKDTDGVCIAEIASVGGKK